MWGVLYPEPTEDSLALALQEFERRERSFQAIALQARAAEFSEERFVRRMGEQIALQVGSSAPAPPPQVQAANR